MRVLKMNADGPDVLGLQRRLLPYQFAFVPGFPRVIGFHVRLLVVDRSLIVWRADQRARQIKTALKPGALNFFQRDRVNTSLQRA